MDNETPLKNLDLIEALQELALDLHWSWSHATDEVWEQLDPVLWELTHNPFVVLQTVSKDKINAVLEDVTLRQRIEEFVLHKRHALTTPAWFQKAHPNAPL